MAAQGLDLEIADGEFMVLVGPSGCGKSTALRMIAGLETPTGGRILIGDRDVTALPPQDRDIAMVFQTYALYPHMTVRREPGVRAPDARRGDRTRSRSGWQEAARRAGARPGARVASRRSSPAGQRQRVALGRAIVREPKVFLFDEPLSNLDAKLRVETRAELARLHRRLGATIVYVTHDQEEAHDAGRAGGGDARRRAAAGGAADGALSPAGQPVRGGVRGVAGDELSAGRRSGGDGSAGSQLAATLGIRPHDVAIVAQGRATSTPGSTWSSRGAASCWSTSAGRQGRRCRAAGGGAARARDRGGAGGGSKV